MQTSHHEDYSQSALIQASLEDSFDALTKGIKNWWGPVDANPDDIGKTFTVTFGDLYWTFDVIELVAGKHIIWKCTGASPNEKQPE